MGSNRTFLYKLLVVFLITVILLVISRSLWFMAALTGAGESESHSGSKIPLLFLIGAFISSLAIIVYGFYVWNRQFKRALPSLVFMIILVFLAFLPTYQGRLFYFIHRISMAISERMIVGSFELSDYKEEPIFSPGTNNPVGIKITYKLHHLPHMNGHMAGQSIIFNPSAGQSAPTIYLSAQQVTETPFDPSGVTLVERYFFPAMPQAVSDASLICLSKDNGSPSSKFAYLSSYGNPVTYKVSGAYSFNYGGESNRIKKPDVRWQEFFEKKSVLLKDISFWRSIYDNTMPKNLIKSGYTNCRSLSQQRWPDAGFTQMMECYCLSEGG